jgi:transcriptional regulator with XRE-family HTH domain
MDTPAELQPVEREMALLLRELRIALGLTVMQWANETGFGERTIESWELSEVEPRVSSLLHVREVLQRPTYRRRLQLHMPDLVARLEVARLW